MSVKLLVTYKALNDLASHLVEHADRGAMLLPMEDVPGSVKQYDSAEMIVDVEGKQAKMAGEVVQVLPGAGLVVRIVEPGETEELVAYATFSGTACPPEVKVLGVTGDDPAGQDGGAGRGGTEGGGSEREGEGHGGPGEGDGQGASRGGGPSAVSGSPTLWSVEQLRIKWDDLSAAQRIRVARYGGRDARNMILKGLDKKLHNHVLCNPKVSADEVAAMAGMSGLDPDTLRRIANSPEWLRHTAVVRNLVCNPKMPLPQVARLIGKLPQDELRRLARTGKVRGSVKQAIVKKLDGGSGEH